MKVYFHSQQIAVQYIIYKSAASRELFPQHLQQTFICKLEVYCWHLTGLNPEHGNTSLADCGRWGVLWSLLMGGKVNEYAIRVHQYIICGRMLRGQCLNMWAHTPTKWSTSGMCQILGIDAVFSLHAMVISSCIFAPVSCCVIYKNSLAVSWPISWTMCMIISGA